MGRFGYLLWCPKGRFVYRTRDGGRVRARLLAKINSVELCCCLIFKFIDILEWYLSQRAHTFPVVIVFLTTTTPLHTKYTNRLNPGNNRCIGNVPLPTKYRFAFVHSTQLWKITGFYRGTSFREPLDLDPTGELPSPRLQTNPLPKFWKRGFSLLTKSSWPLHSIAHIFKTTALICIILAQLNVVCSAHT